MDKDGSVKFGSTKCDCCDQPATKTIPGMKSIVCDACAERLQFPEAVKKASDASPTTLSAAAIELADKHTPTE